MHSSRAGGQPHFRSLPHSKLLHKRDSDKVDAPEENFLPKYQRVKDLCQRAEYQTACEQLGQVRMLGWCPGAGDGTPALPSSLPVATPANHDPGLLLGLQTSGASGASAPADV